MAKKKVKAVPKQKAAAKAPVRSRSKPVAAEEKVMGFRADSQAARMYRLFSDGKARTVWDADLRSRTAGIGLIRLR